MPKKISEKEKEEIIACFILGQSIDYISKKYNYSKITISRNLKQNINEAEYKNLLKRNKKKRTESDTDRNNLTSNIYNQEIKSEKILKSEINFEGQSFIEIEPLNISIDNAPQKDLSSISISDANFPKVVYMVVDKKIELQTKYLKEYPEWQFLSQEELNRKTIEIYEDLKDAKRFCNKEQKVIKVPNTMVFKIAAPLLLDKGISRIISTDKLIAL